MVKPSQKGSKAKFSPDPQATSSPPQRSQLGVSVKRLLEACGWGHLGARGRYLHHRRNCYMNQGPFKGLDTEDQDFASTLRGTLSRPQSPYSPNSEQLFLFL